MLPRAFHRRSVRYLTRRRSLEAPKAIQGRKHSTSWPTDFDKSLWERCPKATFSHLLSAAWIPFLAREPAYSCGSVRPRWLHPSLDQTGYSTFMTAGRDTGSGRGNAIDFSTVVRANIPTGTFVDRSWSLTARPCTSRTFGRVLGAWMLGSLTPFYYPAADRCCTLVVERLDS